MAIIRDNDLFFSVPYAYKIVSGRYLVTGVSVTSGQPSDVKEGTVLACGSDGKFRFRVGRKASGKVADWFNKQANTTNNSTFGHTAGELNFAFTGNLELVLIKDGQTSTYRFEGVGIAQGRSGLSNNWWFAGKTCQYIKNDCVIMDGLKDNQQKVSFTCNRGGNAVNKVDILHVFNQINWMSRLNQALYLDQINLAGTHDTGTYYASGVEKPWVKTQSLTTAEQLRAGIRYLDVRCHHISNTFTIHHSDWYMNLDFKELLENCISFLASNPTETIIMQIKEEHGDADKNTNNRSFYETFKAYVDRNPNAWYLGDSIPSLKQVRGKIVLLRRFNLSGQNVPASLGIYAPFNNNETFTVPLPNNGSLVIQDEYNLNSVNNKWSAVTKLMEQSKNKDNNKRQWFINFTSASKSGISAVTQTPESIAREINGKLSSHLVQSKKDFVGTVVMDFPECPAVESTVSPIINKNF